MIYKHIISAFAVVVFLFLLNHYCNTPSPTTDGVWTVYGTNGCGWTRKQLKHMTASGIRHTFVDCDKADCSEIDAFPTMDSPHGDRHVGYKEDL